MPPSVFPGPITSPPAAAYRTTLRLKRLRARAFGEDDWPLIYKLQTDPRSGPWLRGARPVAAEARSRAIAFAFAENWRRDGYGPHLLILDDTPIGYAGVRRSSLRTADEREALWALHPAVWGQGFATEATRAAINRDAPTQALISWTLPDNHASRRVMEKLGFTYSGPMTWADLPHVVYRRAAHNAAPAANAP